MIDVIFISVWALEDNQFIYMNKAPIQLSVYIYVCLT